MDYGKLLKILVHALAIGVVILFLMFVAMCCNGCGKQSAAAAPTKQYDDRMVIAGRQNIGDDITTIDDLYIWIDKETGVCYLVKHEGGIVVMVDHDGKPFVANGWRDFDE